MTDKMEDDFGEDEDDKSCVIPGVPGDVQDKELCGETSLLDSNTTGNGSNTFVTEMNEEKKPHICHQCYLAFSNLEEFMDHMEIHKPAEDMSSAACYVKYEQHEPDEHLESPDNLSVLNKEEQNPTHDIKIEKCENEKQVVSTVILKIPSKNSLENSAGTLVYECDCGRIFNNIEDYHIHSLFHALHRCELCGKTFIQRNLLNKHLLTHCDTKSLNCDPCGEEFQTPGSGVKPYQCDMCDESFYLGHELTKHKLIHSQERTFGCAISTFYQLDELIKHERIHSQEGSYECAICDETFHQLDDLKTHVQTQGHRAKCAKNSKPYQYKLCSKVCLRKSQLEDHLALHSGVKPHLCNICGKSFRRRSRLRDHTRIHTGDKPHMCDQCGKTFVRRSDLMKHLPVHYEKTRHRCTECNKSFARKCVLDIHVHTHSTETKPEIQCAICGKSFAHKSSLNEHKKFHETPHQCEVCGKKFASKRHLIQHMPKHTGEKSFRCNLCGRSFGHNSSLSNHGRKFCKISKQKL